MLAGFRARCKIQKVPLRAAVVKNKKVRIIYYYNVIITMCIIDRRRVGAVSRRAHRLYLAVSFLSARKNARPAAAHFHGVLRRYPLAEVSIMTVPAFVYAVLLLLLIIIVITVMTQRPN